MRIRRRARMLAIGVLAVVLAGSMSACEPPPVQIVPVVSGLDSPAAFTVDPNNVMLWYAERNSGEIRRRNLLDGTDVLVWTVPNVVTAGEQGLLGLALHPQYPSTRTVFAYATRSVNGAARNQLLRITLDRNFLGTSQTPLLDSASPPGGHHVGGRLQAGPDGTLFLAVGDYTNPANAQNLVSTPGKVLRMTTGGGVPAGNPFANSLVFAYGIRNSFGFDFDPANGRLWLTDNGPTCNDEVNRVVGGGNYAWGPNATCATPPEPPLNTNQDGPSRQLPQRFYPSRGITGAVFCDDCRIDGLHRQLLVGDVNNGNIQLLTLNGDRTGVSSDQLLVDHGEGILSMETRPGQPVYFSTFTGIFRLAPG